MSGLFRLLENLMRHTIHTSAISYSIRELNVSHLYVVQFSIENHTEWPVTVATKNCPRPTIRTSAISYSIRELDVSHNLPFKTTACH